jgi:1,4-alpha-glucan branching enzyme
LPDVVPAAVSSITDENVIRAGEPHFFRLRAPEAGAVSLVADFNGWDPAANPLSGGGDGWWEGRISMPEGSFQYAYWVDGNLVTPPEADVTVDDGFGGQNGMLYVAPIGP